MIGSDCKGGIVIENVDTTFPELLEVAITNTIKPEILHRVREGLGASISINSTDYILNHPEVNVDLQQILIKCFASIPIRGLPETIATFLNKLNTESIEDNMSILDTIIYRNGGKYPKTYNLFQEFLSTALSKHLVLLKINRDLSPNGLDFDKALNIFNTLLNTDSMLLTYLDIGFADNINLSDNVAEDVESFYCAIEESNAPTLTDTIKASNK